MNVSIAEVAPNDRARQRRRAHGRELGAWGFEAHGFGPRTIGLPGADELELHFAELDGVAGFEQPALQQRAVHPHAVGARLVDDFVAPAAERVHFGMKPAHRAMRQCRFELRSATDAELAA